VTQGNNLTVTGLLGPGNAAGVSVGEELVTEVGMQWSGGNPFAGKASYTAADVGFGIGGGLPISPYYYSTNTISAGVS
jgi:hypothetical protein